ncbi:helix-turn-helix domain-containing protein [Streptomyces sp. SID8374]|uniref:helix-turn-helix domain-containing protein n=2 Tax=Streptomyces TaxID=1883 RepID=UPI0031BB35C2
MGAPSTPFLSARKPNFMTDRHDMDELHGDRGSLAAQLRSLRMRRGLTLSALAKRTSYSRSSWERYLNGKALPPATAITEFAAAVGVPAAALLRQREQEQDGRRPETGSTPPTRETAAPDKDVPPETSGREGSAEAAPPVDKPPRSRAFGTRTTLVSTISACTALVAGILIGGWIFGGTEAEGQNREKAAGEPQCLEFECRDKDSQRTGCHIGAWTAAATWSGRTYIELRYSPRCRSAWARITDAHVDDTARVEGPRGARNERSVTYENDTYSPMVEAPYPASARACGVIRGEETCTSAGGPSPMPPALTDEREPARKPAPAESG